MKTGEVFVRPLAVTMPVALGAVDTPFIRPIISRNATGAAGNACVWNPARSKPDSPGSVVTFPKFYRGASHAAQHGIQGASRAFGAGAKSCVEASLGGSK